MSKLRVFESFSGVGSQSMALRNIGVDFEVVGISEVDKYALLGYSTIHNDFKNVEIDYPSKEEMLEEFAIKNIGYNFSTGKSEIPKKIEDIKDLYKAHKISKNYGDITKINENELPYFDLFTYSFPCKNISLLGGQAGLEKGSGTQSSLLWECERIIKHKRPKYLMMENVKNIVGKKHLPYFKEWIKVLEGYGYKNYWKVLDASDYNLPQHRERVIMISILGDDVEFEFPKKQELNLKIRDILEPKVDDKYYLTPNAQYKIHNWKAYQRPFQRVLGMDSICPTITARGAGEYHSGMIILSEDLLTNTNLENNDDISLRYNDEELRFIHKNGNEIKIRKLTPLEAWRVIGFSDEDFFKTKDMKLPESKLYERAGRGIAVPMLERIFEILFKK